jgi:hypothetical protein
MNENYERFIAVSSGTKEGVDYTILRPIREGVNKKGEKYAFIDENGYQREAAAMAIGSIVTYERKRVVEGKSNPLV